MFYPTLKRTAKEAERQIQEPFLWFVLMIDSIADEAERVRLAKATFLYVIATRDALKTQKLKLLGNILRKCPEALDNITDEEMVEGLRRLRSNLMEKRGELISTPELEWVNKYVRQSLLRQEAEKIVYSSMLLGSSHWDMPRREYRWSITEPMRRALIQTAFSEDKLGFKRKWELAKEIGAPTEEFARAYFRKLLWDRHYEKAAELGVENEEDALEVALQNLNAGYFKDALEIVKCFTNRPDLEAEIKQIMAKFEQFG